MSSQTPTTAISPLHPTPETGSAKSRYAPGVRQRFRLPYGQLRQARRDPLAFYTAMARQFGDVFRWEIGSITFHLISHPELVKHVLQDHVQNYPRSKFYKLVSLATGEGLVVTDGAKWRRQRKLLQPAFHRQRINALDVLMTAAIGKMLDRWQHYAEAGDIVDIGDEMMRLAMRIVGEALFSRDISGQSDELGRAIGVAMEYISYRIQHLLAPPLWAPTPRNQRFKRARRVVDRLISEMICERRRAGVPGTDLLGMLLSARDEACDGPMADQQVRAEAVTFLGAGQETTAVALTWTWYLLAQHPDVERRLRTEIDEVLGGRPPTADDLPHLSLTTRVIEESMRLFPPVWMMSRGVVHDDSMGGYLIPAGSFVLVSQYVTHRLPHFWPDPDRFDPDRFYPEQTARRPRFAYFPFAGGPHSCIGNEFAMMEAVFAVAMTMQRFKVELVPGHTVVPDPIFTLRPKHSVLAVLKSL